MIPIKFCTIDTVKFVLLTPVKFRNNDACKILHY